MRVPIAIFASLVGLFVLDVVVQAGCPIKQLSGVPCAGCGGTRALQAVLRGDLGTALVMNPLAVALLAVAPVALVAGFRGWRPSTRILCAGVGVVVLNWVYLIVVGR